MFGSSVDSLAVRGPGGQSTVVCHFCHVHVPSAVVVSHRVPTPGRRFVFSAGVGPEGLSQVESGAVGARPLRFAVASTAALVAHAVQLARCIRGALPRLLW